MENQTNLPKDFTSILGETVSRLEGFSYVEMYSNVYEVFKGVIVLLDNLNKRIIALEKHHEDTAQILVNAIKPDIENNAKGVENVKEGLLGALDVMTALTEVVKGMDGEITKLKGANVDQNTLLAGLGLLTLSNRNV